MRILSYYFLYSLFLLPQELCAEDQIPIITPRFPTIYMIRHGEKPPKARDGTDPPGLSAEGLTRAEGLVQTFGKDSKYNINYIIAERFKSTGQRNRSYNTVEPLARSLDLKIHASIDRDDTVGVVALVEKYKAKRKKKRAGNILICWEHMQMANITAALGVTRFGNESGWDEYYVGYPHNRFDLIWVIPPPFDQIVKVEGEQIPILDDGKIPLPGNSGIRSMGLSLSLLILVTITFGYTLFISL